jgi:hypothetical protein
VTAVTDRTSVSEPNEVESSIVAVEGRTLGEKEGAVKTQNENTRTPVSSFRKVAPLLIVCGLIISGALAAATWAGSIAVNKQTAVTLTGTVSDSLCGNDHGIKAKGDAECTRMCVELGADYALMVGKRLYVLQGHQADLERFAGRQVRVRGRAVTRDTVIVDQVSGWFSEAAAAMK